MNSILSNRGAFWCNKHNCQFTGYQHDMYCGKCVMEQEALTVAALRASASNTDAMYGRNLSSSKSHRATIIRYSGDTFSPSGNCYTSYVAVLNASTFQQHLGKAVELQIAFLPRGRGLTGMDANPNAKGWSVGDIIDFEEEWARVQTSNPVFMLKSNFVRKRKP